MPIKINIKNFLLGAIAFQNDIMQNDIQKKQFVSLNNIFGAKTFQNDNWQNGIQQSNAQ